MHAPLTFISISDAKTAPLSLPEESEGPVLVGAPSRESERESFRPAVRQFGESGAEKIGLVPVGTFGECQWSRLPIGLARLAADPLLTAVFVLPAEMALHAGEEPFWTWLLQQPEESVLPCDPVPGEVEAALLPALAPGGPNLPEWLRNAIDLVTLPNVTSREDAVALQAGLYQLHDDLDHSHTLSQSVQGAGRHVAGDYWHAIMHRREPDYGNSKYWFRSVGSHPVFAELTRLAEPILEDCPDSQADRWKRNLCDGGWDPMVFVDLCQACAGDETAPLSQAARKIQFLEMLLLLEQTRRDAC
jgi:hypothetical protein